MINNPPRPSSLDTHLAAASPRPIIFWPDARLHKVCEDVTPEQFDNIKGLVAAMIATMRSQNGIGLAAPQIGLTLNVITLDIPLQQQLPSEGTETPQYESVSRPFVMINPKITGTSDDEFKWEEGCLSVPGYFEQRTRPRNIVVEFLNDDGRQHRIEFSDLYAFAIQHEMDHLEGKVFVDPLSRLKQDRIKKKIQKALNRR